VELLWLVLNPLDTELFVPLEVEWLWDWVLVWPTVVPVVCPKDSL